MFYSKTGERSPIRALSMQSWHQKITIGATTATDLFSPNTETLESIVDIKTLSISQVDAHVNCVSHLLTVSSVHGCNWIKTTVCFQVPDHRVYLRKTVAPKSGQRHDHVPEQAFRNTQTRSVRRCADIVKVNVRFDCVHRPDIATPGPQRATGRPPPQNLVVEGHMIQVANEMGVPVPLREIPIQITIIITVNNQNVTDYVARSAMMSTQCVTVGSIIQHASGTLK
jgi:hypothetical protein